MARPAETYRGFRRNAWRKLYRKGGVGWREFLGMLRVAERKA